MTKRAEFSKATKRAALARSQMRCEAVGIMYGLDKDQRCNAPLAYGVEYDHAVRAADGGDNSLDNCRAVCIRCHGIKTRKFDTPQAAKTKRMSDKANGVSRHKAKIQSRGFDRKERNPKQALPPRQMYRSE